MTNDASIALITQGIPKVLGAESQGLSTRPIIYEKYIFGHISYKTTIQEAATKMVAVELVKNG